MSDPIRERAEAIYCRGRTLHPEITDAITAALRATVRECVEVVEQRHAEVITALGTHCPDGYRIDGLKTLAEAILKQFGLEAE